MTEEDYFDEVLEKLVGNPVHVYSLIDRLVYHLSDITFIDEIFIVSLFVLFMSAIFLPMQSLRSDSSISLSLPKLEVSSCFESFVPFPCSFNLLLKMPFPLTHDPNKAKVCKVPLILVFAPACFAQLDLYNMQSKP